MAIQEPIDTQDFLSSFKRFMDKATAQVPVEEPIFLRSLRTHFGTEPQDLPTVTEEFEKADHVNLHLTLTSLLAQNGWQSDLRGFVAPNGHMGTKFSNLLNTQHGWVVKEGPVEYINIPLFDDRVVACVQAGLYFIHHDDRPLVLLVRGQRDWGMNTGVGVEVMALEPTSAEDFLSKLRTMMRANNVYRSHVVSLTISNRGALDVQFHRLPQIAREDIILPLGVLERIERQTIGFSKLREKLNRYCRQRLFDLYGQGLTLRLEHLPQLIDQTEGVSAAFIRELLRKAALFVADEGDDMTVEDRHIEEALRELVFEGGELTKRLLGASRAF